MSSGAWILVAAVALALGFGTFRALTDGRFRGTHRVRDDQPDQPGEPVVGEPRSRLLEGTPYADQLGERGTLLQFSSAFCAPCRATRRFLADAAERHPGVSHVEVDAEAHLDVVRRLGILRTPTTLVLDAKGAEVTRAAGAPTRAQVEQVLESLG